MPFILVILFFPSKLSAVLFFLGLAVYIGGGILLSSVFCGIFAPEKGTAPAKTSKPSATLSRSELLSMLFALQQVLKGQKQRRAFLSVDVVGSSMMKKTASELSVEHSFRQFHCWVEEVVAAHGGQIQSAAGDGFMCMFAHDVDAVQAALALQQGIEQFNATHNRLPVPFQIRCGISAGEVPVEDSTRIGQIVSPVLDRAAELQKRAEPGGIVVGGEISAAALMALGSVAQLPTAPDEPPAFAWRKE